MFQFLIGIIDFLLNTTVLRYIIAGVIAIVIIIIFCALYKKFTSD